MKRFLTWTGTNNRWRMPSGADKSHRPLSWVVWWSNLFFSHLICRQNSPVRRCAREARSADTKKNQIFQVQNHFTSPDGFLAESSWKAFNKRAEKPSIVNYG